MKSIEIVGTNATRLRPSRGLVEFFMIASSGNVTICLLRHAEITQQRAKTGAIGAHS